MEERRLDWMGRNSEQVDDLEGVRLKLLPSEALLHKIFSILEVAHSTIQLWKL